MLSEKALKSLYFSLIHCHLNYCNIVWGCANSKCINELFLKQKKAIRLVFKKSYNYHTQPLFSKSNVLPLPTLITFSQLQFMHSYYHNLLPTSFDKIWVTNINRRENEDLPNLRNDQEIAVPFARTNFAQKMPLSLFPKLWNEFTSIIKYDPNKVLFNAKLKEIMMADLNLNFRCNRVNCPSCPIGD
jgi:hypothetical protein